MAGLNDYLNKVQNPAQKFYDWKGGSVDVELPDGSTAKQCKGRLSHWDAEQRENVEDKLPLRFCVLEQTQSLVGFDPGINGSKGVRYYSNEFTQYDEPVHLRSVDNNTNTQSTYYKGFYSGIKGKLPKGCQFQPILYIYNIDTHQIERINGKGCFRKAWFDFGKAHKNLYEHKLMMTVGEKTTTGTNEYIPPKFEMAEKLTDGEMAVIVEKDKIVIEYLKSKRKDNLEGSESGAEEQEYGIDQTPVAYAGEENQDTGAVASQEPAVDDDVINMEDIPF